MNKKNEKSLSKKIGNEEALNEKPLKEKSLTLKKPISSAKKCNPETVVVAANLPHGQCFILSKGRRITIKGNAESIRGQRRGVIPVGAYGFTELKSEDWQEVLRLYGKMDIFKNGLIYASKRLSEAEAEAEGLKSMRHGLEPVDSKKTATKSIEEEQ